MISSHRLARGQSYIPYPVLVVVIKMGRSPLHIGRLNWRILLAMSPEVRFWEVPVEIYIYSAGARTIFDQCLCRLQQSHPKLAVPSMPGADPY
jgi:hypothetical protein